MPAIIFYERRPSMTGRTRTEARGAYQGAVLAGNSKSRCPVRGNGFVFNSMKKRGASASLRPPKQFTCGGGEQRYLLVRMLVGVARVLDHGLNVDHPGVGAVNLNVHTLAGLSKKALNEPGKARTPPRRENGSTPEAILPRKVSFCSLALRIVA